MLDPGDEPPFPAMSPSEIQELSAEAQERQSALKQEAADALEDGNRELALDKLTQAIVLGCASALMYSRRGQILLKLGRPFAAINDCTAAVLMDSELASAFKTRARALSKLEQWSDAHQDFQEALKLDYDEVTYQESLETSAKADSNLGGADIGAEAQLEAPFPEMSPPDVNELTEDAQDLQIGLKQECLDAMEDGEIDAALEKISKAIVLGCADSSMYCIRAETLLRLGRPRAAINDCGAALAADPASASAFRLRARALGVLEQWADAYSSFQESLGLEEDEATREEALAAAKLAGVPVAVAEAAEAEEPGDEPAFPPLAPPGVRRLSDEALERQSELQRQCAEALEDGDEVAALAHASEAIAMGRASALMYCRRAQVLLQLERPRAAVRDCKAALVQNPQSGKALKIRARACAALERWAEAEADYQEALKVDNDAIIRAELEALRAKMKELEEARALAARRRWEIVGGADKGGVVVRDGLDLSSPQVLDPLDGVSPHRLSTGAIVVELKLVGDRLHFQKVKGGGPAQGWISIALKDKVLAIPVASEAGAAAEAEAEEALAEEPPFPSMSPSRVEFLTDEAQERQAELKQQAADALEDGDAQLALEKFTAAIALGCASALMYCRRAQVLLQLGRPRATINDCTAALDINPDSGKAFKIRARAHAKLKHWADSHSDFQEGLRIDYDEDTYQESLSVETKMKGMKAVATEKRLQVEQDMQKKKQAEEKAAEELKRQAEQLAAQKKAQEDMQMRRFEKMYLSDQFGRTAWAQGYMTDFMGVKRGKCKCKKCPIYCWTPVRLSS